MAYLYDLTDTWNAAGTVFNAIKMNVTNSASAAGSKIVSLQVGSTDRFTVDKDGNGYFSGTLQSVGAISFPNAYLSGNSGTIGMQDNSASILAYNGTGSGGITNALRFITGSSERVRINGTGLGIGTTSPSSKFVVSNSGAAGFEINPIGSASAPALYSYNRNTNAYDILTTLASEVRWQTGASPSERMRLDTSGNLGLGATPSAWGTAYKPMQIAGQGVSIFGSTVSSIVGLGSNGYYDGTNWVRNNSDSAGQYQIAGNVHKWFNAAAGSSGTTISFTQAMTLDTYGNLDLGTTGGADRYQNIIATSAKLSFNAGVGFTGSAATSIYNQSAIPMVFGTNNTERMRITAAGYVGIGVTDPNARLSVSRGSAGVIVNFTDGVEQSLQVSSGSGYIGFLNPNFGAITFRNGSNSAEFMRIDSSGNVGIGTSSPTAGYRLQINAGTSAAMISSTTTSAGAIPKLTFLHAGNDEFSIVGGSYLGFLSSGTTERMRIDSSGNVGIGTSSPGSKLSVAAGNIQIESTYGIVLSGATSNGYVIDDNSVGGKIQTGGGFRIFTGGANERMRIDSGGNLGLGTSSPSQKLTVQGAQLTIPAAGWSSGQVAYNYLGDTNGGIRATNGGNVGVFAYNGFDVTVNGVTPVTAMTVTSGGNVGIGTSSPGPIKALGDRVVNVTAPSGKNAMVLTAAATGGAALGMYSLDGSTESGLYSNANGPMLFWTNSTERARIDSSGNLLVGTTSNASLARVRVENSGNDGVMSQQNAAGGYCYKTNAANNSGTYYHMEFQEAGTPRGTITSNGSSVSYNTTSDARLKENIAPAEDAAALIDAIQVRKFDWKADGSHQRYGMIAQELLEVAPEAVSVPVDEEMMMGVDYSKLVPMLIKEVQQLRARVAQLEGN